MSDDRDGKRFPVAGPAPPTALPAAAGQAGGPPRAAGSLGWAPGPVDQAGLPVRRKPASSSCSTAAPSSASTSCPAPAAST